MWNEMMRDEKVRKKAGIPVLASVGQRTATLCPEICGEMWSAER